MAENHDSGAKTEDATPKRLKDARKLGDIAKSKDVTSTIGLAFAFVLVGFAFNRSAEQITALLANTLSISSAPFTTLVMQLGQSAIVTLLTISALILIPITLFGLLLEFIQTGPIFTLEKIKPKLNNLNPASGIRQVFSLDNLMELLKNIFRLTVMAIITWIVIKSAINDLMQLPSTEPIYIVSAILAMAGKLLGWTMAVFLFIMVCDSVYQHVAHTKKMRMSMQEVKKEHKDNEGDPLLKRQRRQLQQEWSQNNANQASRTASVIVVNPSHIAVAIRYHKEHEPVPIVTAKGKDDKALAMRESAKDHHVPVLRNIDLARRLLHEVDEGEPVPRELFTIVAEVILWANQTREKLDPYVRPSRSPAASESRTVLPPGEDLSVYPARLELFKQHIDTEQTS